MKKILITGVCGMVGSHLLDLLLKKGYKVSGLDNLSAGKISNISDNIKNKNFVFKEGNILKQSDVMKAARGANIIIHLAAAKKIGEKDDAKRTLEVNAQGTRNLLEAAKTNSSKFVFASTSDVYGVSDDIPFREDGNLVVGPPTAKRWSYAVSKMYAEQLTMSYYKESNLRVTILRYFGSFSSRASLTGSGGHIPLFIDAILKDKEVIIHGDGKQTRSMGYVDDIVVGTFLAMENPKAIGEIFNIGNDEEISVLDSAYLIHKIVATGKKLKIKFVPHKKVFGTYREIIRRVPDLSKAKQILGYKPKTSLEEGIKMAISEIRERSKACLEKT